MENCWIQISLSVLLDRSGNLSGYKFDQFISIIKSLNKKYEGNHYLFLMGNMYGKNNINDLKDKDSVDLVEKIENIKESFSVENKNVFSVPGIYDLINDSSYSNLMKLFKEKYLSEDVIDASIKQALISQRSIYSAISEKISEKKYLTPIMYFEGEDVNFILLDSTIGCECDYDHINCIIGFDIYYESLNRINPYKPCIILSHHSWDYFYDREKNYLQRVLEKCQNSLFLCGCGVVAGFRQIEKKKNKWELWQYDCGNILKNSVGTGYFNLGVFKNNKNREMFSGYVQTYKWNSYDGVWELSDILSKNQESDNNYCHFFPESDAGYWIDLFEKQKRTLNVYKSYFDTICKSGYLDGLFLNQATISVEKIYIDLTLEKDKYPQRMDTQDKKIEVLQQENSKRTCIIGVPGAGKTTYLKHLALNLMEEYQKSDTAIFPLWISCNSLKFEDNNDFWEIISLYFEKNVFTEQNSKYLEEFIKLVKMFAQNQQLVLLFDGLDEINSKNKRVALIYKIQELQKEYKDIQIYITNRKAGYEKELYEKLSNFEKLEIRELTDGDIREICNKWYENVPRKYFSPNNININELIRTIIEDERIRELAKNPLLLTTILYIHYKEGRLISNRGRLYQKAMELLLYDWNGIWHDSIKVDEAIAQLAYVAYVMVFDMDGAGQITYKQLINRVKIARKGLSDIFVTKVEAPEEFISNIERSSGILVKNGVGNGVSEDTTYRFLHPSFRDYFAALAVTKAYFPSKNSKTVVEILEKNNVLYRSKREEITVWCALLSEQHAVDIVEALCKNLSNMKGSGNRAKYRERYLKHLLLQIIISGARIKKSIREKTIYTIVFAEISRYQVPDIQQLFESRFKKELVDFGARIWKKAQDGKASYDLPMILDILEQAYTCKDIYELYMKTRQSENVSELCQGVMRLDVSMMMRDYGYSCLPQLTQEQIDDMSKDLINKMNSNQIVLAAAAASALTCMLCAKEDAISIDIKLFCTDVTILKKIIDMSVQTKNPFILILCQYFEISIEVVKMSIEFTNEDTQEWVRKSFRTSRGRRQKIGSFWAAIFTNVWAKEELYNNLKEIMFNDSKAEMSNMQKKVDSFETLYNKLVKRGEGLK